MLFFLDLGLQIRIQLGNLDADFFCAWASLSIGSSPLAAGQLLLLLKQGQVLKPTTVTRQFLTAGLSVEGLKAL